MLRGVVTDTNGRSELAPASPGPSTARPTAEAGRWLLTLSGQGADFSAHQSNGKSRHKPRGSWALHA